MPGADLFDMADLSTVWITADIYEFEMPLIKVGDAAVVQLSYFPGRQFSTRIDYIYPTLQGETRTLKARFTLPNEGGRLKPQMFTNVELKISLGSKLAVPSDAVINTGVRQIAYVDKGDGNFEPREVVTGVRAGGPGGDHGGAEGGRQGRVRGQFPHRLRGEAERGRAAAARKRGATTGIEAGDRSIGDAWSGLLVPALRDFLAARFRAQDDGDKEEPTKASTCLVATSRRATTRSAKYAREGEPPR